MNAPCTSLLTGLLLLLAGCGGIQQRTSTSVCDEPESAASLDACSHSAFINLTARDASVSPAIAFVEYDENGVEYDRNAIASVLGTIRAVQSKENRSLLMVVFIHGWNHNAAQTDGNVASFKTFLRNLQREELNLAVGQPRKVVGIYVGWQGKASAFQLQELLSYRRGKELGLETGKSVTPVLRELSAIRRADRNSRLAVVGHSFGAGVLYSAVSDDVLASIRKDDGGPGRLFGDLVVLVNPAVEAALFVPLQEAMKRPFPACTKLAMVSFTSEADTALSTWFPRGMRFFYADRISGDASDALLTTPYGLYRDFSGYALRGTPAETVLTKEAFNRAVPTWHAFRDGRSSFDLGGVVLGRKDGRAGDDAWRPALNVLVDKALIQEHNEIWDPKFTYFLRGMIGMEFARLRECR